jgi:hypothetical protein
VPQYRIAKSKFLSSVMVEVFRKCHVALMVVIVSDKLVLSERTPDYKAWQIDYSTDKNLIHVFAMLSEK